MSTSKYELEKFNGTNDFGLWKLKMKAILMQQGVWGILKGGAVADPLEEKKDDKELARLEEMQDKAYSTLVLHLSDRVLREVSKEDTAAGVWSRLESIYMTKSLSNRLHLKQKMLTFKILDSRGIMEQLEEFGKCVDDLESIDEKIKDEDKALMLLNSLPKSYEHFKDAILLGRDSKITYEEVYSALKLKDTQRAATKTQTTDQAAETLFTKNNDKKWNKKKFQKKQEKDKEGPRKETRSCHYCNKPGHLKKACFAWKRKQAEQNRPPDTADLTENVPEAAVMNVSESCIKERWVMDSGCSFPYDSKS